MRIITEALIWLQPTANRMKSEANSVDPSCRCAFAQDENEESEKKRNAELQPKNI